MGTTPHCVVICVPGAGLKYSGCLRDHVALFYFYLLCFYLSPFQLFKKPSLFMLVFRKTGLFKEHVMVVASDGHVFLWSVL